jgi:glycerol-3-phosphate acyltransferase PlsX
MTRVALDLLGGDHAPEQVVDGALLAVDELPDVHVVLVGPPEIAAALLDARRPGWADDGRLRVVAASQVVGMDEEPARGVRAKRDATVRVGARLVRDGEADALVSVGSTGATLAAALFTLGRLRGVTRPALAAVLPAPAGPVVYLDAGATTEATVPMLCQFALAGAAFARLRLGLPDPRVALLNNGTEDGKGDDLRKQAFSALAGLPLRFVGNVEGGDVPTGGGADVVVTDGFTGNVLLKGLEGATAMLAEVAAQVLAGTPALVAPVRRAMEDLTPERLGGAVLLGVKGVVVVGHGASSPRAVASCVAAAVQAVHERLVDELATAMSARTDTVDPAEGAVT